MSFLKEFQKFAIKGNVVDMAVGIVIGAGFGKIVSSLVSDIIMPSVGVIVGGVSFSGLKVTLKEATDGAAAVTLNYGMFIQTVFDFLIIAFAIFMVVKGMNKLHSKEEKAPAAPPAPTKDQLLLTEIRDLLKEK